MRVLFYYGCLLKIDFQLIPNRTPFFFIYGVSEKVSKESLSKGGQVSDRG